MNSPGFRTRLFAILSLFALVPALALTLVWGVVATRTLPLVSGSAAWERLAESGRAAVGAVRAAPSPRSSATRCAYTNSNSRSR
ncbi:MAG: hypothetical protein IPF47_04925 [Gemmatimonadetes bacterium]|nr:hypothetical protein [Gemmatimonadota bacterium]